MDGSRYADKTKREHRVPLCGRAMEILAVDRTLADARRSPRVFPNEEGKRLQRVLRKHWVATVPHGFLSSLRDWAAEETDHPRKPIEAAYLRSELFERRVSWWRTGRATLPLKNKANKDVNMFDEFAQVSTVAWKPKEVHTDCHRSPIPMNSQALHK